MTVWERRKCPVCNEDYHCPNSEDPFFAACFACREDFGCSTADHVKELIDWMKDISAEERTMLTVGKRNKHRGYHYSGTGGGHNTTQHTMYKAPDAAKVAAGVRALTAYGLTWPLEAPLSLPTNYVMAQNGLFEVRHSDVADIVLALSPPNTSVIGLTEKLQAGVHLNVPKVPFIHLAQTVAFFRGVVKKFNNAEAIVRIWWNVAEQQYEIKVPDGGQRVSGASVHHDDTFDLSGERDTEGNLKYIHVMDIHSHNSMSGFWSGIDDNDERKAPEGRMFGVLGKVAQTIPDWKWRMRSRDGFIDLKVTDVFEVPDIKIDFTAAMQLGELMIAPTITATMSCQYDPFKDAECPEAWYATVNPPSTTTGRVVGGQTGFGFGFRGGHMGATERTSAPLVKSYIFVQVTTDNGEFLEEFEVLGTKTTPTGVKFPLNQGRIGSDK